MVKGAVCGQIHIIGEHGAEGIDDIRLLRALGVFLVDGEQFVDPLPEIGSLGSDRAG